MTNIQTPPQAPWTPSDRAHVQLALGQVHGVLHRAVEDAEYWLSRAQEGDNDPLTVDELGGAYLEACKQLGTVQAALNTGAYDQTVAGVGFSGAQLKAKLKGFMNSVQRYARTLRTSVDTYLTRMRGTLGWCSALVGSVSSALEKETAKIPGAAAAAEALKEFIELLMNAAESSPREASPMASSPDPADDKAHSQGQTKTKTKG